MLKLSDIYFIDSDQFQFFLKKKGKLIGKGKRKGEVSSSIVGCYQTLDALLKKYLHMRVHEAESEDIERVIGLLEQINKNITTIGKEVDHKLWNKTK